MLLNEIFLTETNKTAFILDLHEPARTHALKAFATLSNAQRYGDPEKLGGAKMYNRGIHVSGLYAGLTEHVGDITHRMTEHFASFKGLYSNCRQKIELGINRITENDIKRQVKANYDYMSDPERDVDAKKFEYADSQRFLGSYEDWLKFWRDAGALYADAHASLVVWNEAQYHAREAAVNIGRLNFFIALKHLNILKQHLRTSEEWTLYCGQVTIGSNNEPIPYSPITESLMENALSQAEIVEDEFFTQLPTIGPTTKVSLSIHGDNLLELVHIDVKDRGKGEGSRVLQLLCDLADAHDVILDAYVATDPEDDYSVSDLIEWYERFGFEIQSNLHMRREPYETSLMESYQIGQKVCLNDLYDSHELYDHSEAIGRFVDNYGDAVTKEQFVVHEMSPIDAKKLETYRDTTRVFDAYKKFATRQQKKIVADKKKNFDKSRIVVIDGKTVIDGNHHIVAAIELNMPFLYINLADS